MDEVVKKNFAAIQGFMKESRARDDALMARITSLEAQSAMDRKTIVDLRKQVVVLLASRGTGPTG